MLNCLSCNGNENEARQIIKEGLWSLPYFGCAAAVTYFSHSVTVLGAGICLYPLGLITSVIATNIFDRLLGPKNSSRAEAIGICVGIAFSFGLYATVMSVYGFQASTIISMAGEIAIVANCLFWGAVKALNCFMKIMDLKQPQNEKIF
jgi:hypothetical protein